MVAKMSISIADFVHGEIIKEMDREDKTNTSEFVEELIRLGLVEYRLKKGDGK